MALNYSYDTQEEGTHKARNKQDYMIHSNRIPVFEKEKTKNRLDQII